MSLLIPKSESKKSKVWTVGTLTYGSTGIAVLFAWLLFGDFAWSMRDRSVGPMAAWYMDHIGIPNLLFGLLLGSFPALISLILGPIISVKSDRHRGRWGRRIPFLLITTPVGAFGMMGLAATPYIARWVHSHFPNESEMLVSVLCFAVFWTAFEFATIAGQAIFGALINDVVPKALLGRFFGAFRMVSLMDGIIFNYWLMGKVPTHYTLILFIISLFYGGAFMLVCFKVKEGEYPPPAPRAADEDGNSWLKRNAAGVKIYFKECYTIPYYVGVYFLIAIANLATSPINTFALRYATSLDMSMDLYGKCIAFTYTVSFCLSFFIGWLVDLFHPLRMVIATMCLYLATMLFGHFFAFDQKTFIIAWVLHGILSGCYFTSMATLSMRLFPRHKLAQYGSAIAFVSSPLSMLLAPAVGMAIDKTGNLYRYTFTAGAIIAALAIIIAFVIHHHFMRFGGPKNYVAPEYHDRIA